MSGSAARVRERLPLLWRPEEGAAGPFARLLAAVGERVDLLDVEVSDLLQARWLATADDARWSRFFHRRRELAAAPAPPETLGEPSERELEAFPYLDDLPRLGSLLGQLPWSEPFPQRAAPGAPVGLRPETVEHYRRRLARLVAVYRNGLGTVAALRGIAEAELPVDLTAPEGLGDRPLEVIELAAAPPVSQAATGRGAPADLVGPLMRWSVRHDGAAPAPVSWLVEGQQPTAGEIDPTARPLLELFAAGGARVRRGLGWNGTLVPGQALRVRPAHSSWLAEEDGVARATSRPRGETGADPVAPGPWAASPGAPAGATAFAPGADGFLYAAAGTELWRCGEAGWQRIADGLPVLHCLAADGPRLLLGTEDGLLAAALHPAGGEEIRFTPEPADLTGPAVLALERGRDGTWWAGTADGVAKLAADGTLQAFGLGAGVEAGATRTPIRAIHEDRGGVLYFGGDLGLFQHDPASGDWWWYAGEDPSESASSWKPFFPDKPFADSGFPAAAEVFLPGVRAIRRGPDATLWLGTEAGLARYGARASGPGEGSTAFAVALEALPALGGGAVHALAEDERGGVWAASEDGLFRWDGRDLWQRRGDRLERVAVTRSADLWRYRRDEDGGSWQRRDPAVRPAVWRDDDTEPVAAEPAVRAIAWTDGAAAELGQVEAGRFTVDPDADPVAVTAQLRARWKPDEERIVGGGIPALPRLPVGDSTWRYLEIESGAPAFENLPACNREGRLIAPPAEPETVEEGRFSAPGAAEWSEFDEAAFAYLPAARVEISWAPRGPLAVLVRLGALSPDETLDPALLDRVHQGLEQVRPAGVRVLLAVNDEIVRGR